MFIKHHIKKAAAVAVAALFSSNAFAEGELFFYNWVDYTPPELIEKFAPGSTRMVRIEIDGEYLYAVGSSGKYTIYEIAPDDEFIHIGQVIDGGYFLDL